MTVDERCFFVVGFLYFWDGVLYILLVQRIAK